MSRSLALATAVWISIALWVSACSQPHATSDEDILPRYLTDLPAAVAGLDAVDDREALTPLTELRGRFDRLLHDVPIGGVRTLGMERVDALDAVGRVEGIGTQPGVASPPGIRSFRGGGTVIHDWECSFLFATVAHAIFDLDSGKRTFEPKSLRISVAGKVHEGEQIARIFPSSMDALDSLRTLVDLMLLEINKPRPCRPYPVIPPVSAVTKADLALPGQVRMYCHDPHRPYPCLQSQQCAALVQARPFPPDRYGTDALAYDSCLAPFGSSGCPLVLELGQRRFFLGVQAQATIAVAEGQDTVKDIYHSTRASLLSGPSWRKVRELMLTSHGSR